MANIRWGASRLGRDTTLGLPFITTVSLPSATVGIPYSFTMSATGGVTPYTWTITSDTPDTGSWLSINAATGVLSGTPTTSETESLTIKVTDHVGSTASEPYTLGVASNGQYVGINLNNFGASSNTPSTLNIMKGGQSYTNYNSTYPNYMFWYTSNGSTQDTNEELALLPYLDADGYPTTLNISGSGTINWNPGFYLLSYNQPVTASPAPYTGSAYATDMAKAQSSGSNIKGYKFFGSWGLLEGGASGIQGTYPDVANNGTSFFAKLMADAAAKGQHVEMQFNPGDFNHGAGCPSSAALIPRYILTNSAYGTPYTNGDTQTSPFNYGFYVGNNTGYWANWISNSNVYNAMLSAIQNFATLWDGNTYLESFIMCADDAMQPYNSSGLLSTYWTQLTSLMLAIKGYFKHTNVVLQMAGAQNTAGQQYVQTLVQAGVLVGRSDTWGAGAWNNTAQGITFTSTPSGTSGTLVYQLAWPGNTYQVKFSTGQVVNMTTSGSAAVTFSPAVTGSPSTSATCNIAWPGNGPAMQAWANLQSPGSSWTPPSPALQTYSTSIMDGQEGDFTDTVTSPVGPGYTAAQMVQACNDNVTGAVGWHCSHFGISYSNDTTWANRTTNATNGAFSVPLTNTAYPSVYGTTQSFTFVQTLLNWSFTQPPNTSAYYPADTYTLRFQGKGTIVLGNDAGNASTSTGGVTVSGKTITSTNAWGTTNVVTFPVTSPSAAGINFQITALPDSGNYIKAVEIVQNTYLSNFLSGEIWHPTYKNILTTLGAQRLRSMVLEQINNQEIAVNFTGSLTGATSATISNVIWNKQTATSWPLPTGTYNFLFPNNGVIQKATVNCINGSTAVTGFSTAVTCPSSASSAWGQAYTGYLQSWANRSTFSTCFWNLPARGGVPWEAIISLANELGIDLWGNAHGFASTYDASYNASLASLIFNGTGANLTGSYLSSFTGLSPSKKFYAEWANEPWNFGTFPNGDFCISMAYGINGQTNQYVCNDEFVGIQTGALGNAFYTLYGSAAFNSRVVIRASGQNDTSGYHANFVMNAPDYVALGATAPYLQGHISGLMIPLYVGDYGLTSTDASFITGLANPVNEWFSLAFSHIGASGHTYDTSGGFPANGWIGGYYATGANWASNIATQPWKTATLSSYEFGSSFDGDFSSAYVAMMTSVHRDARMAYVFYDPTNQLWPPANGTGFCPAVIANGISDFNFFQDIYQIGTYPGYYGEWGLLESMLQTFAPLASAPPKYQGVALYIES